MSIRHKFENHNFKENNEFSTRSAILQTPYEPKVLILGTFNPSWSWNESDFFYGRGMYMWTILKNLFIFNNNELTKPRTFSNNNPNLGEILNICEKSKISFGDLILGTNETANILEADNKIIVNNSITWDNYKDSPLFSMGRNGLMDTNESELIKYINRHDIKFVYLTFKPNDNWIQEKIDLIRSGVKEDVSISSVFTPTGNGFRKNLEEFPNRAWSIAHCWLWNNDDILKKPGYSRLNHEWLESCGVTVSNF